MTSALLLLLLGTLSRLVPHPPNAVAMGALALYAGARLPKRLAWALPLAALALSDLLIDFGTGRRAITFVRAAVYGSFAAIVLLGQLARRARPLRVAALSIAGSVLFFLVSNFAVWAELGTYQPTAAGLALCYVAGVPWFWNTLGADLVGTAVLFGLDELARRSRGRLARIAPIVVAGLLFATMPSRAQQPPAPVSESIVVTATASPEEQKTLGAATTVITRDQIEQRGFRTVAEVLRSVPGLDLARSGGDGAITSVFLRGANSSQTLVMVDGIRLNSPFFGGYDFSSLTTENVERIEIVRGPFSALYGSDALGGVIQIFTRRPGRGLTGAAAVEAGNAGQRNGSVFASFGAGPFGVAASFRDVQVENDRRNSDWVEKNGSLRLDGQISENVRFALEGGIDDGKVGVPGAVGAETPHARSTWREERLSLPVTVRAGEEHEATLLVGTVATRPTFEDPDFPFFGRTQTRTYQARAADTWTAGHSRLTGFVSWERQRVDDSSNFGVNLDGQHTTIWGAGAEDVLSLPGGFTATAGARYDEHSQFGAAWSPRATFAWLSPGSRWKLRASAGSAFRAPTVGELYYPFSGNPDLRPERSRSYEIGAERYIGEGRVEASLFWSDFRDLIVYDFARSRDFNIGRARTRGAEVAWRQEVTRTVSIDTGYTYLDAKDRTTGRDLIRRPRHRAFLSAGFRPLEALTVSPRLVFVGRRADQDALTGAAVEDPSYLRWDLFARYQIGRLAPFARVENLTDRRYEEVDGYPAPRRRYAAGLEARF